MPADAVTIDNIAVAPPIEAPPPLPEPVPPPLADDNDAMVRALHAQTRAEEIQRNAAKPPNIDETINAIPGLSEHKRAFLREHPNLLEPANVNAVRFHYHAARNAGVTDDSPEMNRAILDGIAHDRLDRRSGGLWSAGSKPGSGARRSRPG